ncbi:MAG: hypothetical protein KDA20_02920 [Phycisphaerales bacterium]|nr:hypothetical protein [Phycisphaerales bacterium]
MAIALVCAAAGLVIAVARARALEIVEPGAWWVVGWVGLVVCAYVALGQRGWKPFKAWIEFSRGLRGIVAAVWGLASLVAFLLARLQ